jgi:hypothetical protein
MGNSLDSPILVVLLFILRCLVPLIILLGISYLLRRLGLVSEPKGRRKENGDNHNKLGKGGLEHGKS